MKYLKYKFHNVIIEAATFSANNVNEVYLSVKGANSEPFEKALNDSLSAIDRFMSENKIHEHSLVSLRFFLSDYSNQIGHLNAVKDRLKISYNNCSLSVVQQPPLNDNKLSIIAYIIDDKEAVVRKGSKNDNELVVDRQHYKHIWVTQLTSSDSSEDPYSQTTDVFRSFKSVLDRKGLSVKDNCIRTWIYVKDVDVNYKEVVDARKDFFTEHGMTRETHYIASTGIEGRHADPDTLVLMDTYSIDGVKPGQVKFLHALEYLNPTYEYGVTFERGTVVEYGDRKHVFISGTASIDNKGEVVFPGDVLKQTDRALENVSALLNVAGSDMGDVAHMIIFLRDISDVKMVTEHINEEYSHIPKIIVLAPVCRPEWLVEIECFAIIKNNNSTFFNF